MGKSKTDNHWYMTPSLIAFEEQELNLQNFSRDHLPPLLKAWGFPTAVTSQNPPIMSSVRMLIRVSCPVWEC